MADPKLANLTKSESAGMKKDTSSSNRNSNDVESHVVVSEDATAGLIDPAAERALCRKFDLRLLPILAIMVSSCKLSMRIFHSSFMKNDLLLRM